MGFDGTCNGIEYELTNNNCIYCVEEVISFQHHIADLDMNVDISISKCEKSLIIKVLSTGKVSYDILRKKILQIMTINMIFSGIFLVLMNARIFNDEEQINVTDQEKSKLPNRYLQNTAYWKDELCSVFTNKEYKQFFEQWVGIENKLDLIVPMFLFSISDSGTPSDLRLALLSQCAEPFADYLQKKGKISIPVNQKRYKCKSCGKAVDKREKITFLMQTKALWDKYGKDIFEKENVMIDVLLKKIGENRNRLFHVKADVTAPFNGAVNLAYINKIALLYRHIFLQLIGVDCEKYKFRLVGIAQDISNWNGIIDKFLSNEMEDSQND